MPIESGSQLKTVYGNLAPGAKSWGAFQGLHFFDTHFP